MASAKPEAPGYAAATTVSIESSRGEIERTLRRYGADAFAFAEDRGIVTIMFRLHGRTIRFRMELPKRGDEEIATIHAGARGKVARSEAQRDSKWMQVCRRRWRALALVIKGKLEAAASGVVTIEDEFLAQTVLADGATVGEAIKPQLDEAIRVGGSVGLLLEGPRK